MKGISLNDWEWVARLQYKDGGETDFHFSNTHCIDIISAIGHIYQHIVDHPYTEVISIKQSVLNHSHLLNQKKVVNDESDN